MKDNKNRISRVKLNKWYEYISIPGIPKINDFVISTENKSNLFPPHRFHYPYIFGEIMVVVIKSGYGRIKINLIEYETIPNVIYMVMPNTILEVLERSEDYVVEYIVFSPDFLQEIRFVYNIDFINDIFSIPFLKITEQESAKLIKFHEFIFEKYKESEHKYRVQMVKTLLFALFIEIASIYTSNQGPAIAELSGDARILKKFTNLLSKHYRQERHINFYANEMGITAKYLSTTVKQVIGKTAHQYLTEMVIGAAKAFLKASDMKITEIAEELNFPTLSYFCRYFKKYTGVSPKDYRERD